MRRDSINTRELVNDSTLPDAGKLGGGGMGVVLQGRGYALFFFFLFSFFYTVLLALKFLSDERSGKGPEGFGALSA